MKAPRRMSPRPVDRLMIPRRPLRARGPEAAGVARDPDAAHALERVRGEFVEMRGFSPTLDQASRLFGLDRDECSRILDYLVADGFLTRSPDGRYRFTGTRKDS